MLPDYVREVDLIALVQADLNSGEYAGGKWWKFSCPFCKPVYRDAKKFLLVTNGDQKRGGGWMCKRCGKAGDSVKWLQDHRRLSFQRALDALRVAPVRNAVEAVPTAG